MTLSTMEKSICLQRLIYQLLKCKRHYSQAVSENIPRITVPQKMVARINKVKELQAERALQKSRVPKFKSPLLISCKRPEYNHHKGQTYSEFNPKVLASHGWKHNKSAGDHLTLMPYKENPSLIGESEKQSSFADFALSEDILNSVERLGLTHPTYIQKITIPKILQGTNVLCAAETGSGKTLAYLLPALELINRQKLQSPGQDRDNTPRAIILAPSRELADQILDVCKQLSDNTDFTVHGFCGGRGTKHRVTWRERAMMDILVSTPGVLKTFLSAGLIHSQCLQHIILDEADSLLDDSFSDDVRNVLKKLKVTTASTGTSEGHLDGTLFTMASATMPRNMQEIIGDIIPMDSLARVTTDHLHLVMPHVSQTFLRVKMSEKAETIVKLVRDNVQKGLPTLIFCNKTDTSFWLGDLLKEHRINNAIMNGSIADKRRRSLYEKFMEGRLDVMVATDIASRGLDLLSVHHVINFDFPHFISDYIHRVGRVGRVGSHSKGHVTSFIVHKYDVDLLWEIETSARQHKELHNVNANITRKMDGIIARKFPNRQLS